MMPELLPAMLSVEALEDNEVLKVEGVRTFSRICDKKQKTKIELLNEPNTVRIYGIRQFKLINKEVETSSLMSLLSIDEPDIQIACFR